MPARAWIGHATVRIIEDCTQCKGPAVVRDPATAAMSGRSWVDCPCGQHEYRNVDQALCRKHFPVSQ